jgi:hypothetical protein
MSDDSGHVDPPDKELGAAQAGDPPIETKEPNPAKEFS